MSNNISGTYFPPDTKNKTIREIQTIRMNYKAIEPTKLGRIYRKEDLVKMFDTALENTSTPVVRNASELYEKDEELGVYKPIVSYNDIIGFFKGYEIKEDGEIHIKILPVINTDLFDGNFSVCTGVIGNIRKDKSVELESLVGFFLVGDMDIINKKGEIVERVKREEIVNELIILTGNIGCGKSTFARENFGDLCDWIIVNDDAITTMIGGGVYTNYDKSKKYLYKDIELMCVQLGLENGYNVVVDMPNMKSISRKRFINIGKRYGAKIRSYDWGSGNITDLSHRLKNPRGYDKWEESFNTKKKEYEKPSIDEGFNDIARIKTINNGIIKLNFEYE